MARKHGSSMMPYIMLDIISYSPKNQADCYKVRTLRLSHCDKFVDLQLTQNALYKVLTLRLSRCDTFVHLQLTQFFKCLSPMMNHLIVIKLTSSIS